MTSVAEGLRLQGPPGQLRLTGQILSKIAACRVLLPDSLAQGTALDAVHTRLLHRRDGTAQLSARLPEHTPPGEYDAQLEIDGETHTLAIKVEPQRKLAATPNRSMFAGVRGASVEATVRLFNQGNVGIDIPESDVLCLYDERGVEDAFNSMFQMDSEDPLRLIGHLVLKLRDGSGGPIKLRIGAGAGELPPGADRAVSIRINLPEKLKPGRSYDGFWRLGPLRHSIRIEVDDEQRTASNAPAR